MKNSTEKNNEDVEKFSLFNDKDFEEMKACGLSDEEIENIKDACAYVDVAKKLPKDYSKFMKKFDEYFPNDVQKAVEVWGTLADKDPEFFAQILAVEFCFNLITPKQKEQPHEKTVEKISTTEIKDEQNNQKIVDLIEAVRSMSPNEVNRLNELFESGNQYEWVEEDDDSEKN